MMEAPCLILTEVRVEWASGVGASQQNVLFSPEDGPTPTLTFTRPAGAPGLEVDQAVAAKLEDAQRSTGPWATGRDFFNSWKNSPEQQAQRAQAAHDRQATQAELARLRQQLWDQVAAYRRANIEQFRMLRCTSDLVYRTVYTTCY